MYSIRLEDGTELTGLTMDGNHFVSNEVIERKTFIRNLGRVEITSDNLYTPGPEDNGPGNYDDGSYCGTYENLRLVQLEPHNGGTWFRFEVPTAAEREMSALRADVDYMLMMQEV